MTKSIFSTCLLLLTGVAIGIVIQNIPQSKIYIDHFIINPIIQHDLFKQFQTKMGYPNENTLTGETFSSSQKNYIEEKPTPEEPISSFVVHKPGYSLAYDARLRNPSWVFEHLTADNTQGTIDYSNYRFREDDNIPENLRTSLSDYKHRSLERAQMASAENHLSDQQALNATFALTNVCPQCPVLNQEYWPKLNEHTRNLARRYTNVYTITGPLFLPFNDKEGRFVKYRVIGPHDVAVPSHFFKVLILEDNHGKKEMIGYILPNHEIPSETPLEFFQTSVANIEKAAGILIR